MIIGNESKARLSVLERCVECAGGLQLGSCLGGLKMGYRCVPPMWTMNEDRFFSQRLGCISDDRSQYEMISMDVC